MAGRILENIELSNESSRSYIDALYAVLSSGGLYKDTKYMLAGMTGMAFVFTAHKNLIPASVDVYSLKETGWRALDILGFYSEIYAGANNNITFPLHQKKAAERIKQSVDNGIGVVIWAPRRMEFGVVHGYDDEDEVFYCLDRLLPGEQILLYKNLGKTDSVFWMCQIVGECIEKDIRDIYMDSLEVCVDEWETPYKAEPHSNREYGSGRKAYEYMIKALEDGKFHNNGAIRIIRCNILCKKEIYQYLNEVMKELPDIKPAVSKYKELNEVCDYIDGLLPDTDQAPVSQLVVTPGLLDSLKQAKETEELAVSEVKKYLKDILNNRYIDALDVKKF